MASTKRPAVAPAPLRVLLADDQPSTLGMLTAVLRSFDCEVVTAADGAEAVREFERTRPDCVILDMHMPSKNGLEACAEIKALSADRFTPVMVVTSDRSHASQTRAAQAGADDCLFKPVTPELLQAKVKSLAQIRKLHDRSKEQQEELETHRNVLRREHELARALFEHVLQRGGPCTNVQRLETPADVFHGDLVLTSWGADGRQFILVGDFTGHGLQAALGALPAADIFHTMTRSGFGVADLVRELNKRISTLFPPEMFPCACLLEIDHQSGFITAWNGGLPPVLVRDSSGRLQTIESTHVPLGVLSPREFDDSLQTLAVSHGDRIYVYSDGVIEQTNADGQRFDFEHLRSLVASRGPDEKIFDSLKAALAQHSAQQDQEDDITLIEVLVSKTLRPDLPSSSNAGATRAPLTWSLDLSLEGRALASVDPKPLLMRALYELQGLDAHREALQTVFSELYRDALDHGLLHCDTSVPRSPAGFAAFLAERDRRLEEIEHSRIDVSVRHEPTSVGGRLSISVCDDGTGAPSSSESSARPHAQSLDLARSLCVSLDVTGQGRRRNAVYEWKDPSKEAEEAA